MSATSLSVARVILGPLFLVLDHVLNHANLFAGGYVEQSGRAIDRLLAEIA